MYPDKVSDEQRKRIVELRGKGLTPDVIAKRLGLTKRQVRYQLKKAREERA